MFSSTIFTVLLLSTVATAMPQEITTLGESNVVLASDGTSGYNKTTCNPGPHKVENPAPGPDARAPDHFFVKFPTTVTVSGAASNTIVLEVNRTWAPLGVDRFYALVQDNYYNCAAFFRVVPNFVVQWGIAARPEESAKWDVPIVDDPVVESNRKGMVSFAMAGPGTRTTQIFVNTVDNQGLDTQGFAPFARVVEGMEAFLAVDVPIPDPSQNKYTVEGNTYILDKFPNVDIITGVPPEIVEETAASSSSTASWSCVAAAMVSVFMLTMALEQ